MKQGDIWRAELNPIKGSEQAGYRPVVVLSGNLMNKHLNVVICCPLTTKIKRYKGNLVLDPNQQNGLKAPSEVLLFHIRSVSKERLRRKIGVISQKEIDVLKQGLDDILRY